MNGEIARVRDMFLRLYEQQRARLATLPTRQVEQLHHEADEIRRGGEDYSVRTAADINHGACWSVLNERGEI